ncbi:MAG: hypothetical protein R3176_02325 [Woeseiaceae bacterium]|nr:hypothetical protein [Woeseiaceae bacterium]
MNRVLLILTLLVAQSIPVTAESREKDLDRWMERDLIPHVRQELLMHPRFKGETVMFVVLDDNTPTPVTNALALSLRDRLLDAAINTPGVSVGWQQGRQPAAPAGGRIDCERDAVHYYIGLELEQELDGSYSVAVRALDLEDRSWVSGFGKRWQGELRTSHRQAFRQTRVDRTFQGSRDVPFTLAETDLLARHLAHHLSCAVFRQGSGRYVVGTGEDAPLVAELATAVELASQNLVRHDAVELAADAGQRNARIEGKAHRIDGPLFQYWLTVTPLGDEAELSTLSSSAYVLLPEAPLASDAGRPDTGPGMRHGATVATTPDGTPRMPLRSARSLLSPLRIAGPAGPADCGLQRNAPRVAFARADAGCSLLETKPERDAILFFLAHQARHGLVRLGGADCRDRTPASIATTGRAVRFPIPRVLGKVGSAEIAEWPLEPEADTYFAIATTDTRTARALANHIDRLPQRCNGTLRPGLEGHALARWLEDFSRLAEQSHAAVDWRGLQVRDIL